MYCKIQYSRVQYSTVQYSVVVCTPRYYRLFRHKQGLLFRHTFPCCWLPSASSQQVLLRHNISGAPVVDPYEGDSSGSGKLVGVLSEEDLLWKEVEATDKVSHNS